MPGGLLRCHAHVRPERRERITHEHEPIVEEASLRDLRLGHFGDERTRRFGEDFREWGDDLRLVAGDLVVPEFGIDEALGNGAWVDFAVDVGENGRHFWRAVWHDEVPDPIQQAFARFHMAYFGRDQVAGLRRECEMMRAKLGGAKVVRILT